MIFIPPLGAFALRVTVPVDVPPPTTVEGLTVSVDIVGEVIVISPPTVDPVIVAFTFTRVEPVTGFVVELKLACAKPSGTKTECGTTSAEELELRVIVIPPVGAEPVNFTVPVVGFPPATIVGLKLNEASFGGTTVSFALAELDPRVASIAKVVWEVTGEVSTENVAVSALRVPLFNIVDAEIFKSAAAKSSIKLTSLETIFNS